MTGPQDVPAARLGVPPAPSFPKRFYENAEVAVEADGFFVRLDGRNARTPGRNLLRLPTRALADAITEEWTAVEHEIDPRRMPYTRLANSIIDGVASSQSAVLAEVVRYSRSDLLAYRAGEPERLVRLQAAAWDPIVDWSRDTLQAPLILSEGVMFVEQPGPTLDRLSQLATDVVGDGAGAPFRLGGLHVMTTLTGSLLLALAVAMRRLTAGEAWSAAHVDEDFQISEWGEDADAALRRAERQSEMFAAAKVYERSQ